MIQMNCNIAAMPGFEWTQVSENKFYRHVDENVLVRQTNGKIQRYYDCACDAITAVAEMHNVEYGTEMFYYVQKEKKH